MVAAVVALVVMAVTMAVMAAMMAAVAATTSIVLLHGLHRPHGARHGGLAGVRLRLGLLALVSLALVHLLHRHIRPINPQRCKRLSKLPPRIHPSLLKLFRLPPFTTMLLFGIWTPVLCHI
jgi:ABC-type uncharacterized transport system permease subunit